MILDLLTEAEICARREKGEEIVPIAAVVNAKSRGRFLVALDAAEEGDEADQQAIRLGEGESFEFIPETRRRVAQHVHVSGPSGSGKSTWAGDFARRFREAHDDSRVVVVSADPDDDPAIPVKGDDPAADDRIKLTADLGGLALDELMSQADEKRMLVIFDDVEGVEKPLADALVRFRQAVLERGRRYGLSSLNIFHKAASGRATRDALAEATAYVLFPRGGVSKNTLYMLENYAGQPSELADVLKRKMWGRAVVITNTAPQVCVGEHAAMLLDVRAIKAAVRARK